MIFSLTRRYYATVTSDLMTEEVIKFSLAQHLRHNKYPNKKSARVGAKMPPLSHRWYILVYNFIVTHPTFMEVGEFS